MHVLFTHSTAFSGLVPLTMPRARRYSRLAALALAIPLLRPDLLTALLWLAVLVLVPEAIALGERLIGARPLHRSLSGWPALAAGIALVAACALPAGIWAGLLAVPWLAIVSIWAVFAANRLRRFPRQAMITSALDVAMLLMLVGAAWVVIGRFGWSFGFDPEIVRLTGIHFHYAGFLLPTLAAAATWRRPTVGTRLILPTVMLGFGLVAIGITFSPPVEVVGAAAMVVGCVALAVVQLREGLATRRPDVFSLLAVSSVAIVSGMALAAVYALGEYLGRTWIDIPTMIATHGLANAIGFAGCGLLGWSKLLTHREQR
jgi:hypothetical protein